MTTKLLTLMKTRFFSFILVFSTFFFSINTSAQCAGISKELDVCDIANPSSKAIDLFAQLGGAPTPGGSWEDLDFIALSNPFKAVFNTATGILNAQLIPISGKYRFRYNVAGCTDKAIVTVTVGGYLGTPAPTASVCDLNGPYNLFQVFNGSEIAPQLNGVWSDDNSTGGLLNEFFIPSAAPAFDTPYSFTYTIPAIGNCPAPPPAKVVLTVIRAPRPGEPKDLAVCSDKLENYTNLNLFDYIEGEDPGGIWEEAGTNELTSLRDSEISLKNIYENFGEGTYRFRYALKAPNRVCPDQSVTVSFCIDSKIDFSQAKLTVTPSSICEKEITSNTYEATLEQNQPTGSYGADGDYEIEYEVANGAVTTTAKEIIHFYRSKSEPFLKGITTFPIDSEYFKAVGNYTINVKTITRVYLPAGVYHGMVHLADGENVCYAITKINMSLCTTLINVTDDHIIHPTPKVDNLVIDPICKGTDASVVLIGTNLIDGDSYQINYSLSGSNSQTVTNFPITVNGGGSNFVIPKSLIPVEGTTSIKINNITNLTSSCTYSVPFSKDFIVKPAIDLFNLVVSIDNVCLGNSIKVTLKGLNNFSQISVDYDVTGANIITNQSTVFSVVNGAVDFTFPASRLIASGLNTLHLTKFVDLVTGCELMLSNNTNFTLYEIPANPLANDVRYCKDENKTVASLRPNGSEFKWFNSATTSTVLNNDELLITGSYYVSETNSSGCVSSRTSIAVTINDSNAPILIDENSRLFCGLDKPTLQDLDNNIDKTGIGTGALVWFDAVTSGNALSLSELLEDKKKYYAFSFISTTGCYSSKALEVEVSLFNCDAVTYDFFIPDGFSPNGDNINDTFNIPNIDLIFPNFTLEIYNRYGNLIFSGNKNKPSWNGENSDSSTVDGIAPNGVYFYVINFNKNNELPKQGRLYLNR